MSTKNKMTLASCKVIRIPESGNFFAECGILGIEFQNPFAEKHFQNSQVEPTAWNPESNTVLDYLT